MGEVEEFKMMLKKFFLILFALLQNGFGINTPCENNDNCQDHQYCAASNLQCIDCFNCSYINREALKRCSKSFEDCGGCIDGFQEILLTDRAVHRKKPCQQKRQERDCADDVQCPDEQFCSDGLCRKCIDCKIYNRNPSSTCARTVDDCGSCFPGFLGLTKSSRLMPCIGSAAPLVNQSTAVQVNFSAMPFIVVLLCLSGAFLGFFMYRIRKQHGTAESVEIDSPPPYVASYVRSVENEDGVEQSIMCTSYKELGETDNAARVFRLPNYMQPAVPVEENNEVDNSSDLHLIQPAPSHDSGTSIHDEDTMPCFWRPCDTEQIRSAENENGVEQSIMCTSYKELCETDNAARVFRLPNYVQPAVPVEENNEVDNSSDLHHIQPAPSDNSGTSIHDEDTMPCFWRPCYTEQSDTPESFVGRLQPLPVPENPEPSNSDQETDARPLKRQKVSA